MRLTKPVAIGTGVGIGAIQSFVTREYADFVIPFISDYLPINWAMMSSLGNIIIGGIATGLSFTRLLKDDNLKTLLKIYGLTTVAGGAINGFMPKTIPAGMGMVATLPTGQNGYYTSQYYPYYQGKFLRRPASRARGFASDVTRNPMAAIPTEIPYNKVLF